MVVSMRSADARSKYNPDTPVPVPTSTAERALMAAAKSPKNDPVAGEIDVMSYSWASCRAREVIESSIQTSSAYAHD